MADATHVNTAPAVFPARLGAAGRTVLLLHLILSPLLFSTWTAEAFEWPKAALLTATALTLAALMAAAWFARGAPLRPRFPIDLATVGLTLFTASATLSTFFSINPLISWRGAADSHAGLQTVLGYFVLYLATRFFCVSTEDGRRLLTAVVVGSALSSAYALVQAFRLDPIDWKEVSAFADHARPFGTMGHANFLAAYLVTAGPLVALFLPRAAARRRWAAVVGLTLVLALAGAAVVVGLSRAAWLAGAAALAVLAVGWFLAGSRRAALTLAGLTALAACVAFVWWTTAGMRGAGLTDRVAERLVRLDDGEGRRQIWQASWGLFLDRPLLGCGPDAFQLAFGSRRPADYANAEWDVTPTRAHNLALHLLATQGLVGATAGVVFLIGLAWAAVRAWRRAVPDDRPTIAAVVAGLTAFLVQDLFGFTVIGCGTLFITGAALLSSRADPNRESRPDAPHPVPATTWKCVLASLGMASALAASFYFFVVRPLEASIARAAGDRAVTADPTTALACYERAVALDSTDDRAWNQLSAAAVLAARQSATPQERRRLLDEARGALRRAAALGPSPFVHASLGRLLGEMAADGLADGNEAVVEWDAALSADPLNACFLAEAARTALAVGRIDRARRWAGRGLELYPQYALLYAQKGACDLAEAHWREADAELERSMVADWHGDQEECTRAIAAWAVARMGRGEFEGGRQLAEQASRRDPTWATPCLLQACALIALGRPEEARAQYRRAHTLDPSNPEAETGLRQTADKP